MLQLRPTFSESWYRVVNLKARLRASAQISRQFYRGERWYVVRDPAGNQYHRLSDAAYRFVGLLDGSRTVGEAWDLVGGTLDDEAPTQPEVIQILSQLHAANLLESDITADSTVLLRRHKMQMKQKMQGRLMNVLFPRIPLVDPDWFLKIWLPVARWIMSPLGAVIWLAVVIFAVVQMIPHFGEFKESYQQVLSIGTNPEKAVYLFIMFWMLKCCHELGHAFSCRRFGGEVHEMGIMFLVFIPTPYVDASSAWAFPSRWARMFVGAAGMIVEVFLAALCAIFWVNTKAHVPIMGLPLNELACDAIWIAGFTTIIFNANPLLRYDGYYMLSDWLEIPNLQQKSNEYLLGLVKRHVFRIKSQQPLPPWGQRIWLFFYGIASSIYRVFVGIVIILLVAWQVPVLGILMAIGGIVTWACVPIFKLVKYLALEPELHRKRGRAMAFCAAVVAVVIIAIGMIRFNVYVDAAGVLEPVDRKVVNAQQPGFVTDIRTRDGQWVKQGDVLIVLTDRDLDANLKMLEAQLAAAKLKANQSFGIGDSAQEAIDRIDIQTYQHQLAEARREHDELTIRAPIDGQVVAPDLIYLPNAYVPRGTQLLKVETTDKLLVRTIVDQRDVALASQHEDADGMIQLSKDPQIRLSGNIKDVLSGGQAQLINGASTELPSAALSVAGGGDVQTDPRDPQAMHAASGQFEMRVSLANPKGQYVSGQKAWVRLTVGRKPLIWNWYNRFLQLIEAKNETSNKWMQI